MKKIAFLGASLDDLKDFPANARRQIGYQLRRVQNGLDPSDFKSMTSVGAGVYEIRTEISGGNEFRVLYVAKFESAVFVLHCFRKKTQKTPLTEITKAKTIYKDLVRELNCKK